MAALASLGLFALQHRGQESAGIAVTDGRGVMVYKDLGLVAQVLDERRLPSLRGHLAALVPGELVAFDNAGKELGRHDVGEPRPGLREHAGDARDRGAPGGRRSGR